MPANPVAACSDKAELTRAWVEAAERFSNAARLLRTSLGTLPKQEDDKQEDERLRAEVESAKLDATNARMMLELHRQEHGC